MGAADGTFYFDNMPNQLDQVLVNRNMADTDSTIAVDPASVAIFRLPGMFATGKYPRPVPFGGMGKPVETDGYSDHFPVTLTVTEAD